MLLPRHFVIWVSRALVRLRLAMIARKRQPWCWCAREMTMCVLMADVYSSLDKRIFISSCHFPSSSKKKSCSSSQVERGYKPARDARVSALMMPTSATRHFNFPAPNLIFNSNQIIYTRLLLSHPWCALHLISLEIHTHTRVCWKNLDPSQPHLYISSSSLMPFFICSLDSPFLSHIYSSFPTFVFHSLLRDRTLSPFSLSLFYSFVRAFAVQQTDR